MTIFQKAPIVFCSEPHCKNPPFSKYLKSETCANHDDVHRSFFTLLGPP